MLVTRSRTFTGRLLFKAPTITITDMDRLRWLSWRRMHELGYKTYQDLSEVSGIPSEVIRRVFSQRGRIKLGPDRTERWLTALQLDDEDQAAVGAWIQNQEELLHPPSEIIEPDQLPELLVTATRTYEVGEFNQNPLLTRELYRGAAHDFMGIAALISDDASPSFRIIKAEALYRLACVENLLDLADHACWHALKASWLADGIDGDLHLLAKKEAALAYIHLGRSASLRKGFELLKQVRQPSPRLNPILGSRFPNPDPGLWLRLAGRDAVNVLIRRYSRTEAREWLHAIRKEGLSYREEPMDGFLLKTTEASLHVREGHPDIAMRILLDLYNHQLPEPGGPRHRQTLLQVMAEAQVMVGWRDPDGRNYLREALTHAQLSGLIYNENDLKLQFRKYLGEDSTA